MNADEVRAIRAIKAAAWDEGYRAGSVDGYYETREEENPYRDGDDGERS